MADITKQLADALRKLEQWVSEAADEDGASFDWHAINADEGAQARAALAAHDAEQAQQSELASILARLEAVPVAWPSAADIADEIDALLPMSHGDSTMAAIEEWWRQLVKRKLSKIAPPAAEPLTDDDAYEIASEFFSQPWYRRVATEVVRATERAHGIGASGGEVQK